MRKRWKVWDDFIGKIEAIYSNVLFNIKTETKSIKEVTEVLCEVIQNPSLG